MTVNPVERAIRGIDRAQQRHRVSAFAFGVIKKYGDDNGGRLAGSLAHSAFVSVFPLLIILVTVLGLVAAGNQALRQDVLNAVARQFPGFGNHLNLRLPALRRPSVAGLIIGLLWLLWGATGLAQAALLTMEQVWNLPGPARPGYLPRLARALIFLGVLGAALAVTTLLTPQEITPPAGPATRRPGRQQSPAIKAIKAIRIFNGGGGASACRPRAGQASR